MRVLNWIRQFLVAAAILTGIAHCQEPFGGQPHYVQPTPLTVGVVNTGAVTDYVSISGDQLTIYFNTERPGASGAAQIWSATRPSRDADWENAQPLPDIINAENLRALEPDVTENGLELFFRRSDVAPADSYLPNDQLLVAQRASPSESWSSVTPLPDHVNNLPCINNPTVTGDGLELYFAVIDTPGEECRGRNADIYVTKRASRDDSWSMPEQLQAGATTPGISPNGLQLYYYDGPTFVRTRESREDDFGPPVEIGNPPNGSGNFAAWGPELSSDGTVLYFSSDRAGSGSEFFGVWETRLADLCDLNGDGQCDADDLTRRSLFRVDLTAGSERQSDILKYDINGDARVDDKDLTTWLADASVVNGLVSPYLPGDANLDGEVSFEDFLALSGHFDGISSDWSDGNFNGDRDINFQDFLLLSSNFGDSAAVTQVVPEPNGLLMLSLGLIALRRKLVKRPCQ